MSFGGRQGRSFAAERQTEGANVFDAVVAHAKRLQGEGKRVIVACWSNGARERLATLLAEHGVGETKRRDELRRGAARAARRDGRWPCCRSRPASRRRGSP